MPKYLHIIEVETTDPVTPLIHYPGEGYLKAVKHVVSKIEPERYCFHISADVWIDAVSANRPGSASSPETLKEWLLHVLTTDKRVGGTFVNATERNVKASVYVTREEV